MVRYACLTIGAMVLAVGAALAAEGNGPVQGFRSSQAARRQAHREKQHRENRQFRESIRGLSPCEKCREMICHCNTQFAENKDFRQEQHERRLKFVDKIIDKKDIPPERQQERLDRIEERYGKAVEFRDGRHGRDIAVLETLAADADLTREEMRGALKTRRQERRAETEAFREGLKAQHGGGAK